MQASWYMYLSPGLRQLLEQHYIVASCINLCNWLIQLQNYFPFKAQPVNHFSEQSETKVLWYLTSDTTKFVLINTLSDKDNLKTIKVYLVGFLNRISMFKLQLAQYSRLKDICMQR
jgi:hypothetical protein